MVKTLIVYQSLYGSTEKIAKTIADILKKGYNHNVEVYKFRQTKILPNIIDYDNIIVGSGIFNGKWGNDAQKFLKNDFAKKKVAVFVCSGFAGEKSLYKKAYKTYLENVVENYPQLKPIKMEAFGGRVPKQKIPDVWSQQVTGKLPKFGFDNRNLEKVKNWANEVGSAFEKNE